uniref:Uncharacterized protein n=1 Tax=Sipha flava TaxID=143950 RepID=A0A2S2QCI5_9HEMI
MLPDVFQSTSGPPEDRDPRISSTRSRTVGPAADTAAGFRSTTRLAFADVRVNGPHHHHGCHRNIIVPRSITSDIILSLLRFYSKNNTYSYGVRPGQDQPHESTSRSHFVRTR